MCIDKATTIDKIYKNLAQLLYKKHKPTKLQMLKFLSVDRSCVLGFPCPFHITERQRGECIKYGAHEESVGYDVTINILNLVFNEFCGDMNFLLLFGKDHIFWMLNLKYYYQTGKTIFEDFEFPKFNWEAWEQATIRFARNSFDDIASDDVIIEQKRQEILLKEYIQEVNKIAREAIINQ